MPTAPTKPAPAPVPQLIGDRTVPDPKGEVVDYGAGPVWLSLETCGCGYSMACPGVGYRNEILQAWVCKRCGEPHTAFISEEEYGRVQKARIARHMHTKAAGQLSEPDPDPPRQYNNNLGPTPMTHSTVPQPETTRKGATLNIITCRDCRHWQPEVKGRPGLGTCHLFNSSDGKPEHENTLAFAEDLESYQARVVTRPDFGCVMGQPKESPAPDPA